MADFPKKKFFVSLGSFHKLFLQLLAFLTTYLPSLYFLCSKLHVFLTTYSPLSANVICESSFMIQNQEMAGIYKIDTWKRIMK